MIAKLIVLPQYLLPKVALTQLAGRFANLQGGALTTQVINWFVKRYHVDMSEAAQSDTSRYATFNDFFTRPLRSGARLISDANWVSPVDGSISQLGRIEAGLLLQAKGHHYSSAAILACTEEEAREFSHGHFACLYLSPKDYHRIHMPCSGLLRKMVYVPGSLFSVNPTTAEGVPGLFARNERVVCHFDTEYGHMVMVLVGATIVGSMATVWHGVVNPPRGGRVQTWDYAGSGAAAIHLEQGAEMGRFLLGSTVVMLWPDSDLAFDSAWRPGQPIRMGQSMAQIKAGKNAGKIRA